MRNRFANQAEVGMSNSHCNNYNNQQLYQKNMQHNRLPEVTEAQKCIIDKLLEIFQCVKDLI